MPSAWLTLPVIAASLTVYACFDLARRVEKRSVGEAHAAARGAYAWCWRALGAAAGAVALGNALALAGVESLPAHRALLAAHVLAASLALGALVLHLSHIVRGRGAALAALVAGAHFAATTFVLFRFPPSGIVPGPVRVALAFPADSLAVAAPLAAGFVYGPFLLVAVAYAGLLFSVGDPSTRYRVVLQSASLLQWSVTSALLAAVAPFGDPALDALLVVESAVAPAALLLAGRPPAWAQRKWGLSPLAA